MIPVLTALLCLLAPVAALAQGGSGQAAPTAATRYINTDLLASPPPVGIPEYVAKLQQLEREFGSRDAELRRLGGDLNALQEKQAQASRNGTPDVVAKITTEIENLLRDIKDKRENAQRAFAARRQELLAPIGARVSQGAQRFRAESGMADLRFATTAQADALKRVGAQDVTPQFVAWYAANPSP